MLGIEEQMTEAERLQMELDSAERRLRDAEDEMTAAMAAVEEAERALQLAHMAEEVMA